MQAFSTDGALVTVIKVGGSILRNARAYRRVANFLRNRRRASPQEHIVVVVSAQEGVTDALERVAKKIARNPNKGALDLLWSTGELRSVALLTLHLQALGIRAAGLNIHETGLTAAENDCDSNPGNIDLNAKRLRGALANNHVVVVPGFFSSNAAHAVVSLGRGGSDLTAVLLARWLNASRCELIKDVPGYFTRDPHRDSSARPVPLLTFKQALELADDGCDLVQRKAIEAAAHCNLPLIIRSLDETAPFTRVGETERETIWVGSVLSAAAAI
jgi:aspartate kinase